MLRAAARGSVRQGSNRLQSSTPAPTPAPKKSGGGGKKLLVTTGLVTAASGSVLGYAYVDPEFRKQVESALPPTKQVFDSVLGEASLPKTKVAIQEAKQKVLDSLPKPKQTDVLPPLPLDKLPPIEKKPAVHVDPVNITPPVIARKEAVLSEEEIMIQNKRLEDALVSAIAAAEHRVQTVTDAKMTTIQAIRKHAQLLKKTVDDGGNANWEVVTAALHEAEKHAKSDSGAEMDGRNYVDNLKKIINEGKTSAATKANPLLLNAQETALKLGHQLDEINVLVNRSRKEASVFTEYKDLIDRSRQQFALELKSILPNVDVHAKDANLSEDELNALIAHAHLRVDQLRQQLAEQQVKEEDHIRNAIEQQKRASDEAASERLAREVSRLRDQAQLDVEREVVHSRSSWETQTEEKLARATQAHAEHLEQVIRTQRQLFEIEHNQKVEEAVTKERDLHSRHVGAAYARLEGIEAALSSRVALDAENRRSKQFWIACHNLMESILNGSRAGKSMEERRCALEQQLDVLKQVNPEDSFVSSIIAIIPDAAKKSGCYTTLDLKNRFDAVYNSGRRTAMIDSNGGSIAMYLWSYARSFVLVDLPRKYSYEDKFDVNSLDNVEILARAKYFVERNDMESAAKMLNLLEGQASQIARDWISDARTHMETKFLAELLVAHAAVQSIRSTY